MDGHLHSDIRVPGSEQVPYVNQVVVLVEIFRLLPRPTAEQRTKIVHWFWQTAISGYFGGWNTGNMSADQAAVANFATGKNSELVSGSVDPRTSIWLNQQFRLNTAHAKILSLMLAFNNPVDLLTGQPIDTANALHYSNSKEFHHFFPKNSGALAGISSRKVNALANFIMLTAGSNRIITNRSPSDYLKQIEKELGAKLEDTLERNLISMQAYQAALRDDYESFLSIRAETIAARAAELAQWPTP